MKPRPRTTQTPPEPSTSNAKRSSFDVRLRTSGLALLFLLLALVGCRPAPPSAEPLRIGVLPILDSLPLYVAAETGRFDELGVDVELIPVASSAERDQLLQANQVDGVITDLVALALYNRDGVRVQGVRVAMVPTETFAQFRVLAAGESTIATVEDLSGVPIGVSKGTIIEYVTEAMLTAEGLTPGEVETLAVPKIPERMALLNAGDLRAATLPEPLASLAMQRGARLIVDDRAHPAVSASLYAFCTPVIEERPDAVAALVEAVNEASLEINADPTAWGDLLREKALVPPDLAEGYALPTYPDAAVPDRAQFADVTGWLRVTDRLDVPPVYEEVITDRYLAE